jgi:hypothetical protein
MGDGVRVPQKPFQSIPKETYIASFTALAIGLHLVLQYWARMAPQEARIPLYAALLIGGAPLVLELGRRLIKREFGSDLLAGISILTSVLDRKSVV